MERFRLRRCPFAVDRQGSASALPFASGQVAAYRMIICLRTPDAEGRQGTIAVYLLFIRLGCSHKTCPRSEASETSWLPAR